MKIKIVEHNGERLGVNHNDTATFIMWMAGCLLGIIAMGALMATVFHA